MKLLKKIFRYLFKLIRFHKLRKKNIFIDTSAFVDKNTTMENYIKISKKSIIINCKIGMGTYIQSYCDFKKTKIGRWCSIASNVKIIYGNHPTTEFVSTHPIFYSLNSKYNLRFVNEQKFDEYSYADKEKKYYCVVGNDVWIGSDVLILNGVKIGNGSIIAAGSVVTKDVPDYAIVGGVPAKLIKYRFSNKVIKSLEKSKWWENDIEWLKRNSRLFSSVDLFLKEFGENEDI